MSTSLSRKRSDFEHVGADRLEIAMRLQPVGIGHHRPLEAVIGEKQRAPVAAGDIGGGRIEAVHDAVEDEHAVDAHAAPPGAAKYAFMPIDWRGET